ncbi:MAG: hypothetical protein LQ348_002249 [Seirophora lacunosa]|nr:MAG: hypothetical protein LQ348_002249 [Seirophora lacunosa]
MASSYGVSRVYLQQCGYTLSDAQNIQMNMRILSKVLRTASLDPNAGKARPEQLVLEDDPAFVPDMVLPGLDLDLAALDITTDASSRRSSILSPYSQRTSLSSQQASDESALGLIIPSSDGGGEGGLGGFDVPSSEQASVHHAGVGGLFGETEDDFNLDPGFIFDNDGNIIDTAEGAAPLPSQTTLPAPGRIRSDSGASSHVRRELREGMQAGQVEFGDFMDFDNQLPRADNEQPMLPQAEAFPPLAPTTLGGAVPEGESSSEAAVAPQQRKRRERKVLPVDQVQELRNTDLTNWDHDYITNMDYAKISKIQHKAAALTKQNAAFWVFGGGIGGIGAGIGASNVKGSLVDMFSGDALLQALTGIPTPVTGRKRIQDEVEGDESPSEARRVRMRLGDEELGRAQGLSLDDDDAMVPQGSEAIEMGRHGRPSLEDTSQFPWNRRFASSVGGFGTSGGRPSSLPLVTGAGSLDRRASRITSLSPLVGRGPEPYSDLDVPQFDDNDLLGGPSTSVAGDDFQIYGPAANVETQDAAQSQWLRTTLDTESSNFLEFIRTEVSKRATAVTAAQEAGNEFPGVAAAPVTVAFEELLPPTQNTKIVGAQALLHVLALATKGLLAVEQQEDYGPIYLSLVAGL